MTAGFQTQVYGQPAPAVEGDFASQNPYYSFDAGPGALVAGASGVVIGRFAWVAPPTDANGRNGVVNSFGAGVPDGFVHREQQGLFTAFLGYAGMTIQAGYMVTLLIAADVWVKNNGSTQALPGQKAYATLADGSATFAATASPTQGASVTASVAAATSSVTGSITGNVLTVTAVGSGTVYPGTTISGTGVASGTKIVSQISGTTGGVGTYYVSIPEQTVTSTTISGTYGLMTVTAVGSGALATNTVIAGSGVDTGTKITALGTGTGGTGTYIVDSNTVVGSTTVTTSSNVETGWTAQSSGLPGELVKISRLP
jgi:hypothetical protein